MMSKNNDKSFWCYNAPLLLASTSVTRATVLKSTKIPFIAIDPEVDERALQADVSLNTSSAGTLAMVLATAKARALSRRFPGQLVLGGDQTMDFEGNILSKARSKEDARIRLAMMAGRKHSLFSAFSVVLNDRVLASSFETASLTMRRFDARFLDWYLETAGNSVLTSVGCYEVEGLGIHLFDRIDGDHSTILGLPLLPILAYFRVAGYLI